MSEHLDSEVSLKRLLLSHPVEYTASPGTPGTLSIHTSIFLAPRPTLTRCTHSEYKPARSCLCCSKSRQDHRIVGHRKRSLYQDAIGAWQLVAQTDFCTQEEIYTINSG